MHPFFGSMIMKILVVYLIGFLIAGCAPLEKHWIPLSGSKADGMIKLGYQNPSMRSVSISDQEALDMAQQKCHAWGYVNAVPFGNEITTCEPNDPYCFKKNISRDYQCIDNK